MQSDLESKQRQIQDELSGEGVSRRGFIDKVKALGLGFGAAFLLGVKSAQANTGETVSLNSTNPALDSIIHGDKEAHGQAASEGEKKVQEAWYRRWWYRRFYGYRRFYYRRRHYWYRRW